MPELGYTTQLAIQRTVMAADRTLMAWIRTALSMISFGFTIYKIIHGLQDPGPVVEFELDGRRAGLILCGLGVVCIIVGMIEYFMTMRDIRAHYRILHWRYALVIASMMLVLGVMIFLSIWTRFA